MSHRLAVTVAGAVSLGSFEAGVLFEVLDALKQHNASAAPDDRILVDVLTGASAGGMTAALVAQRLLYDAQALSDPYANALYDAWVTSVDIDGLLPLDGDPPDQSILSSDFVYRIAERLLLGRYGATAVPTPLPHPALSATGVLRVGLALSNLNGVAYERSVFGGGNFAYTRFQDQITFVCNGCTDTRADWAPVAEAAVACGAFPFAFRPRGVPRYQRDYTSDFLVPFATDPYTFTYTDGGVFQNEPLGLAKNLVDEIDDHRDTDTRSYLFVSPSPHGVTLNGVAAAGCDFKTMAGALVNAVYNQAGFRDWIEAESVNTAITTLNDRAATLSGLLRHGTVKASTLAEMAAGVLPALEDAAAQRKAHVRLVEQFRSEYDDLVRATDTATADAWIDTIQVLERAADLHEKDEMAIYAVTADRGSLAGAGLFAFFGFLYRDFRKHDYDLGRQHAQQLLLNLKGVSGGRLPQLRFTPRPIDPIQPTPAGGFTAAQIPKANRQALYDAISQAADVLLQEAGLNWPARKGVEWLFVNRRLKEMLGL
ncbi:MAG TPA: patatin-like phospholipase family protein [Vicinamibacterales bacterium]|nr:patatin-like phospholipase family protein [Vicinamibacterales bacterium]